MMYLFAGRQRHSDIAAFLRKAELSGTVKLQLMEFDIERSPEHDLTDGALWERIFDLLKEGGWVLIVSPPCNTFSRARFQRQHLGPKPLRTHIWPRGFPWLSNRDKEKVSEANLFVDNCLQACNLAGRHGGNFIFEHPEDLGAVQGIRPGSVWQWDELLELIPAFGACCFAVHQCQFGAQTPKPTRFLTTFQVDDLRCHCTLPKFDRLGMYKGPLPKQCGHIHEHKLIGKTNSQWNTAPSASYPAQLCEFLAQLILNAEASYGGGCEDEPQSGPVSASKRRRVEVQRSVDSKLGPTDQESGRQAASSVGATETQQMDLDSAESVEVSADESQDQFDMAACGNAGRPIQVEWDRAHRGFIDGFGLCSPCRWKPHQRGVNRSGDMVKLADSTFQILAEAVKASIKDVRLEAFKLVTGKLRASPFSAEALAEVRTKWFALLGDPASASVVDEGQPFFLQALAQWLRRFEDPDVHWLVDVEDSFATGVYVGVDKPLPRSPQIFPPKLKHRKLDDTEFAPIAENYASAQLSTKELEEKFREEEGLGRMHPSKLGVLREEYGDKLRIAAMAAIVKPDGSVRPLHDATHSVMVNHSIVYKDKIDCPGPAEISSIVREAIGTSEAVFCVSADIRAAHRLVKIRKCDWGFLCCRADSGSTTVWVNRTGTFGVSSAPYWWAKLAGLLGRFVGYMFHQRWMMQMIYVDDLHGAFVGRDKFLHLWIWVLAYELIGTPFGYHKFKGGLSSEFVGFQIRYDLSEVGISMKRGDWLTQWIVNARKNRFVVTARDFSEFLGRLGFVAQLVIWVKPHLAPLFAWAAVTARSTVGKLPDTIILTLGYLEKEFLAESYLVSVRRPRVLAGESFRTDAKCADSFVVLAGWELQSKRWFSLRLGPEEVPYLFKEGGGSQWASTAAELMATLLALHAFGWLDHGKDRKTLDVVLSAGTDNKANEALSLKRSTTRWPLMAVNMQLSSSLARARLTLAQVAA